MSSTVKDVCLVATCLHKKTKQRKAVQRNKKTSLVFVVVVVFLVPSLQPLIHWLEIV